MITKWDTWTKLVPIGNIEAHKGYYITNDVIVGQKSFCLHTFGIVKIKRLWFHWNAYIFRFHYTVDGAFPPRPYPQHFSKLNFIFLNITFYHANQYIPRRHKNKHWTEWATVEEYWYAFAYKALFISTSSNFLQPSQINKKTVYLGS